MLAPYPYLAPYIDASGRGGQPLHLTASLSDLLAEKWVPNHKNNLSIRIKIL
jgi:hypothetical protein